MLTEQEKLKEAITSSAVGKDNLKAKEYGEILKEHQNLTLGMISTIEEQRQVERDSRMNRLVNRIETLEREKAQQDYYAYYGGLAEAQKQAQQKSRATKAQKLATLNDEELKKYKDSVLAQKDKRETLLKAMGLAPDESSPTDPSNKPPTANPDLEFTKDAIQHRLRTLDGRRGKKLNKPLRPFQKFRGLAKVIRAWFFLRRYTRANVAKVKEEMITFMRYDISLHVDVVRAWLLQTVRPVLLSVAIFTGYFSLFENVVENIVIPFARY